MSLLYFAVVSGLVVTLRHVRQIIYTLAGSLLVAMLLSLVFGAHRHERLILSLGTYNDPNLYSMCLLMVLPMWWLMAASSKSLLTRLFPLAVTVSLFWAFFNAGSRASLLGLIGIIVLVLIQCSFAKKIAILVAVGCG